MLDDAVEDAPTLAGVFLAAASRYSGTLERYAGDGVMVIFNDPVPVENPAFRANTLQIIAAPPTAMSVPIVCQAINVKARCSATAGSDGLQTCSWYKGDLHHKLVGSGHAWTHCEFWRDRMGLTAAP